MSKFFYDSLTTLKNVKKPTKKELIDLTIVIFVVVTLFWIFFAFTDWIFMKLYKAFYSLMTR
jgi:preprotein translocase SecE subunit